jgi:hypothetical protein
MFQRTSNPFRGLLSLLDDVLGDPSDEAVRHPHRQPLRLRHQRRAGSVAARPAHCISPVRATSPARERDRVER